MYVSFVLCIPSWLPLVHSTSNPALYGGLHPPGQLGSSASALPAPRRSEDRATIQFLDWPMTSAVTSVAASLDGAGAGDPHELVVLHLWRDAVLDGLQRGLLQAG